MKFILLIITETIQYSAADYFDEDIDNTDNCSMKNLQNNGNYVFCTPVKDFDKNESISMWPLQFERAFLGGPKNEFTEILANGEYTLYYRVHQPAA